MKNFGLRVDLLKLKNAFVTNFKGKKETKRCLIIPVDDAQIFIGEKGVYLDLTALEMKEKKYDDTHVLKQKLAKAVYEKMSTEEQRAMPILGAMRELEPYTAKEMKVDATTVAEDVVDSIDDLPF